MIDTDYTTKKYNTVQYKNDVNLKKRIIFYSSSTNPENWYRWVFRHIPLNAGSSLLELGCGTGELWNANQQDIPQDVELTLLDLNEGMLKACQNNLVNLNTNIKYCAMDIAAIGSKNVKYDVIVANHVLYHLPDLQKSLSDMHKTLKSNGYIVATTVGLEDSKELAVLFRNYDRRIPFFPEKMAENFGVENGKEILQNCFREVAFYKFENTIKIANIEDIVLYSESLTGFEDIVEDKQDFRAYLQQVLEKNNGNITITKTGGLFVGTKN